MPIRHRLLMDDGCSMHSTKLFWSRSFDSIQKEEVGVGGNDDLHPSVKVITDDHHAEWSAMKGVPSGMVRSSSLCISLSHYEVHSTSPYHEWLFNGLFLTMLFQIFVRHTTEGSWW